MGQNDLIPTNFIIKVFETKALAEANDDLNALRIFNNGIDGDTTDPRVSNGSQYVSGTANSNVASKLVDTTAKFGSNLLNKTAINQTDATSATIADVESETTLLLDSDAFPDGNEVYFIERPGNFFLFQKYFYRIEATDPVLGFIIDWDDGEDNSPEKANRQTIKLDSPQYYAIAEHTYTHHGVHYPMLRTISPEGFYSKWHVSHDAVVADVLKSIETQTLAAGQNDFSIVSVDLEQAAAALCRMPEFAPANMPPIGVLKVDRTSVFSGIDNAVIDTSVNNKAYAYVDRTGGTALDGMTGGIEVIFKTTTDRIFKDVITPHSDTGDFTDATCDYNNDPTIVHDANALIIAGLCVTGTGIPVGATIASITDSTHFELSVSTTGGSVTNGTLTFAQNVGRTFPAATLGVADGNATDGYLKEVLSVKLVEMREGTSVSADRLGPDERIYIQVYNVAAAGPTAPMTNDPVTIVSLGNPVQTLDRPGFSVFADGSQSQTRAGNVSISKYWFEEGKLAGTLRAEANGALQISDAFGMTVDDFDQTESGLHTYYSFNHHNILMDATTKRFPDEERLYRLQVEDGSSTTRNDDATFYDYSGGTDVGKNTAEGIDGSEVNLTIQSGSTLVVGDVFKIVSPDSGTGELLRVLEVVSATEVLVERGFQDTDTNTYLTGQDIYRISDGGRQGDTLTTSFIEHWDAISYYDQLNRPTSLLSRGMLLYGNMPTDGSIAAGSINWTNRMAPNNTNSGSTAAYDTTGDNFLVFGGTKHSGGNPNSNFTELTGGYKLTPELTVESHDINPLNYILCGKTDKFNKIHIRMNSDYSSVALNARDSDWYSVLGGINEIKNNMMAWYTAKTAKTASTYMWKPLPIVDGTSTGYYNSSLRRSGTVYFDMPDDWVAIKASDLGSSWTGPVGDQTVGGTAPANESPGGASPVWADDMYGLLLGLAVNETTANSTRVALLKGYSVIPYNNTHSQAIKIVDPHHKSLNDVAITQDISFSRAGKYIEITDRLGRAELRRIGAAGGNLTFGGVELTGDFTTTKTALLKYQREGTPVYLDVEKKSGDFIRAYGVITAMSETYPVGNAFPKFSITMGVEYVAEYDSSGDWISSGLMALGGEIIDEPRYIL